MRVRMKAAISGSRNGEDWPPAGGTLDLSDEEAAQLIGQGLAVDGSEDAEVGEPENAAAPDTAEKRPARSRKGVITKE